MSVGELMGRLFHMLIYRTSCFCLTKGEMEEVVTSCDHLTKLMFSALPGIPPCSNTPAVQLVARLYTMIGIEISG